MKKVSLFVHLWLGLVFGTILVVLGLTGSALAWMHELDGVLNPGLLHVAAPHEPSGGAAWRVDSARIGAVSAMLAEDQRFGQPSTLSLPAGAGDVFIATYRRAPDPAAAAWAQPVTRQVMIDPATLRVTGERNWGEFGLSRPLLMSTLFHVHRYLIAGEVGKVVVAVTGAALLLLLVSGMLLWWPRMARRAVWHALTVRHGGSWPRFSFQLHRAGGFFAAPVFFVIALSGIYFNMPQWVTPVVEAISPLTPRPKLVNQAGAQAAGVSVAAAVMVAQQSFPHARVSRVSFPANVALPFEIRLRQPGERRQGPGATRVSVDAGTGKVLRIIDPVQARGGDQFLSWMFPLHTGEAFGLAGRIFISLFGMVPLAFFVTGLVIWVKLHRKKFLPKKFMPKKFMPKKFMPKKFMPIAASPSR